MITKGCIIRRKLKSGTPIGPHMIVTRVTNNRVDAYPISCEEDVVTLDKENIVLLSTIRLKTPGQAIREIVMNDLAVYSHEPTKTWLDAADKEADIVILYSLYGEKAYFSGCSFSRIYPLYPVKARLPWSVRLEIGNLIYYEQGERSRFCV